MNVKDNEAVYLTMEIKGDLSLETRSYNWRLLKWKRSREGKDLGVTKGSSGMERSSERRTTSKRQMWQMMTVAEATFEKMNMAEDPSWTLRNVDFLVKVFCIRDTFCHRNEGQILTTASYKSHVL